MDIWNNLKMINTIHQEWIYFCFLCLPYGGCRWLFSLATTHIVVSVVTYSSLVLVFDPGGWESLPLARFFFLDKMVIFTVVWFRYHHFKPVEDDLPACGLMILVRKYREFNLVLPLLLFMVFVAVYSMSDSSAGCFRWMVYFGWDLSQWLPQLAFLLTSHLRLSLVRGASTEGWKVI